jgi:3'-phosphoadenosine 5'-phosphosulfate sulfotransferase (PAPS reductase)/FAD synthetase
MMDYQLSQKQSLPLNAKINLSKDRIRQFYERFSGEVYVSFSGGKDSTVLLNLVRSMYPDVEAVFIDTGLEYPEIRDFVKTIPNVTSIKPKMCFLNVIKKYGYPVVSKDVSKIVTRYRKTKLPSQKKYLLFGAKGKKMGVLPKKWRFLLNAPFLISDECCRMMKKNPICVYEKKSGKKPFMGVMASDSEMRKRQYIRYGCNVYEGKIRSHPLSFWTDKDIWNYIRMNKIPYAKIYDSGIKRTGCMFCMFGCHLETEPNRFQLMKKTHPKMYDYCINKLEIGKVLSFINVPYDDVQSKLNKEGGG